MSDMAPLVETLTANIDAVSAGNDLTVVIGEAPFAGTVTAVVYVPVSAITGANTNTRTLAVTNKALDGTGTTSVASLALTSGHDCVAGDENTITLSGTAGHLVVASGDVLEWTSTHAASGLADPGGQVRITLSRS